MPIATTIPGTISGESTRPATTTRNALGRRVMPSAASVPSTVDSTTTTAATQMLSQVGCSQSRLLKRASSAGCVLRSSYVHPEGVADARQTIADADQRQRRRQQDGRQGRGIGPVE